jgi:hypothetical protein
LEILGMLALSGPGHAAMTAPDFPIRRLDPDGVFKA